jgi:TrmH family RNA methyltransferase
VKRNLSVTLVGPQYPLNVGYTARLMKNFGITKLFLVEPKVDLRIASIYASHGADLVLKAEKVDFEEVRRRHELLVATTAIRATRKGNITRMTMRLGEAAKYIASSDRSTSIVFGRDTTGLRNEEIERCDLVTSLETGTVYRTLNLSHAAAIIFYTLSGIPSSSRKKKKPPSQSRGARELLGGYGYKLSTVLGLEEHRARNIREIIQRIALKSELSDREITSLLALLRKAAQELEGSDRNHTRS